MEAVSYLPLSLASSIPLSYTTLLPRLRTTKERLNFLETRSRVHLQFLNKIMPNLPESSNNPLSLHLRL
jgi:hypothetical protein